MRDAETVLGIAHEMVKVAGKPDDGKLSRPVRRGAVGKVSAMITRWPPTLQEKASP